MVAENKRVPETYLCLFLQTKSVEATLEFVPRISLPTVSSCGLVCGRTKRSTEYVLLFIDIESLIKSADIITELLIVFYHSLSWFAMF
jgi:hypothetical protein